MRASMKKIPCLILVYYDFNVIRTAIDALLPYTDRLDLIIIENKSEFTESHIRPYIEELLNNGTVLKYFLFNKNITNNVFECVLDPKHIDFASSDYIILTDGDLLIENEDWLSEQISIMENNPDVLVCAVTLSTCNLPVEVYPPAAEWAPRGTEYEMYFEDTTGAHFLLMRLTELQKFLDYRKQNGLKFLDFELANYCREIARKKWVRTKKSVARHLTWDSYHDLEHPYTKLKLSKSYEQTWAHNSYSSYHVLTKNSVSKHVPLEKIIRGHIKEMKRRLGLGFKDKPGEYQEWNWQEWNLKHRKSK